MNFISLLKNLVNSLFFPKTKQIKRKKIRQKKKKTISHSSYICDNDIRHSVSENSESTNWKKDSSIGLKLKEIQEYLGTAFILYN